MSIDSLVKLMPPPSDPAEARGEGWPSIEARLGVGLPADYKEFVERYGSGQISGFLWIFNPFSENENMNLERQLIRQAAVYNDLKGYGEVIPYSFFPDANGIFPFGITDNGDLLFWKTVGGGEEWSVVLNAARESEWEEFDISLTEFLVAVLSRNLMPKVFPSSFPVSPPYFKKSTI